MNLATPYTSPQTLIRAGICLAALFVFGFFGLYGNVQETARLKGEIAEKTTLLEQQKVLKPFVENLDAKCDFPAIRTLPGISETPLPHGRIDALVREIMTTGEKAGLEVVSVAPEPAAFSRNSGALRINCKLRGDFDDLRGFLMNMTTLPYANRLQSVSLNSDGPELQIVAAFRFPLEERKSAGVRHPSDLNKS